MKHVLIICGGKSAEHEVSLQSARNIISALDRLSYQPVPVVVSRSGTWYHLCEQDLFTAINEYQDNTALGEVCTLMRYPDHTALITEKGAHITLDMAFPLIHGPMGEDGTLQGLLELMELPYVGSGVSASAIGMDKILFKQILMQRDIPVVPMLALNDPDNVPSFSQACAQLGSTILFIKPSVMGSSVGVNKAKTKEQYAHAIQQAFRYDRKVLVERYIAGRELECAVLGNDHPLASCVGEIKPHHEFYSYEAKYLDAKGADLIIPAPLADTVADQIKTLAIRAYQAIECQGLARVDFFLAEDHTLYINELNTLPGFTAISMYPKMWEASGIHYTPLINKLLSLAMETFEKKQSIHLRPELDADTYSLTA